MKYLLAITKWITRTTWIVWLTPLWTLAMAGGGTGVGNGGGLVHLPDGTVKLGDRFIDHPDIADTHHFSDFDPLVRAEIELAGRFLVRYGADAAELMSHDDNGSALRGSFKSRTTQAEFIVNQVSNPKIQYRIVDALPSVCTPLRDIHPPQPGSTLVEYGCTDGPVTFLLKSQIEDSALTAQQQALAIIHERMHALTTQFGHEFIADTVNGLDTVLTLYSLQAQGQRPKLTPQQIQDVRGLINAIQVTGLASKRPDGNMDEFSKDWQVAPNGGGLVHTNVPLAPDSYLGVGSLLGAGGSMSAGSAMFNSACYLVACQLDTNSMVTETSFSQEATPEPDPAGDYNPAEFDVKIGAEVQITSSQILLEPNVASNPLNSVTFAPHSKLTQSTLIGLSGFSLEEQAQIANVHWTFFPSTLSQASEGAILALAQGAILENAKGPILTKKILSSSQFPMLRVSPSAIVDFKNQPLCSDATEMPILKNILAIGTPSDLQSVCDYQE